MIRRGEGVFRDASQRCSAVLRTSPRTHWIAHTACVQGATQGATHHSAGSALASK